MQAECGSDREPIIWSPSPVGKIIYASRTHSQLRQVVRQFNSTVYKNLFKPTVIGSRDHMCINSLVKKETTISHKNMRCHLLVKGKQCKYHHVFRNMSSLIHSINVMEELAKPEASKTCCPYYLSREAIPISDIIFMPYNYLIDLQMHKNFKFNLSDSVIIIDEGHNVAKVCEESSSVSFSSANIATCLSDITDEMQYYYDSSFMGDSEDRDYTPDDLVFLQQRLHNLEAFFSGLNVPSDGIVHKGSHIFEIFSKCDINDDNKSRVVELLMTVGDAIAGRNTSGSFSSKGVSLKRLGESIQIIYTSLDNNNYENVDSSFKVYLENDNSDFFKKRTKKSSPVILNFWCFNPGYLLKKLLNYNLRSIIITSGTLSPLHAVVEELGFSNAVTLSSKHIVQPFQVLLCTLAKGPMNYELRCTYSNRENEKYWRELGMTIVNLSRHIPNGLLVFFPSYTTMRKANELWSSIGVLTQLSSIKTVFVEPNNKDEMEDVLANYSLAVDNNTNGAVLFGVCRGKISEGLDFSGKYARGVIITGIPYAPPMDMRVQLKRDFININKSMFKDLTGDVWYHIDAMRAINQAVGRAIRHSADYGVIVLCDSRFHLNQASNQRLPAWLIPYISSCQSFGSAIQRIRGFFRGVEEKKHLLELASIDIPKDAILNQDEDKFISLPQIKSTPDKSINNLTGYVPSCHTPSTSFVHRNNSLRPGTSPQVTPSDPQRFSHVSLFNQAVVEAKITPDTELIVKPAKKRKIKITASEGSFQEIRRNEVKSFILDVKLTLDENSYASFAFIVKKYNQTNDFDETVAALRTLFLSSDIGCEELFKGCYRLFSEEHRIRFNQCVEQLFPVN